MACGRLLLCSACWPAGCCLPVGVSLLMNASVVHMCMHVCLHRVCRHVERPVCAYAHFLSVHLCVFVLVCPAVTLGNKAGNRRGVEPEQVIKKNPCKMALLWLPLGKQRRNVWRGMRAWWLLPRTRTERFMTLGD